MVGRQRCVWNIGGMCGTVEDYLGHGGLQGNVAKIETEDVDYYIYRNIPCFKSIMLTFLINSGTQISFIQRVAFTQRTLNNLTPRNKKKIIKKKKFRDSK